MLYSLPPLWGKIIYRQEKRIYCNLFDVSWCHVPMAGDIFETDGYAVTRIILASTWPRQLHRSDSEEGGSTQNAEVSGSRKALAEGSVFLFEAMHTVPLPFFYCIVMNLWVNNSTIFIMTLYNSPKPTIFLTILEAFTELVWKTLVLHTNQCLWRIDGANTESIICGDIKIFWVSNSRMITCKQQVTPATVLVRLNFYTEVTDGEYKISNLVNYSNSYIL